MCSCVQVSDEYSASWACCVEMASCLFCGCVCSFCFHPCIVQLFRRHRWQRVVDNANNLYYDGIPVLEVREGPQLCMYLVVNTEFTPARVAQHRLQRLLFQTN
jgi:radical SAM superfamily enzyme with C-terminal helix-hairpin-helix motif